MMKLTRKEKILIGVSVISLGSLGVLGYKYLDAKKTIELLTKDKNDINDRLNFIEFLVIESECIPKALQNGNNKFKAR